MAHVELSLSESFVPQPRQSELATGPDRARESSLDRWAAAVADANEPCLVIDGEAMIIATSATCCSLLGLGDPGMAARRFLLDGVVRLVDFTAARSVLTEVELDKIPPLLALSSGRLARGLMRVYDGGEYDVTVDAVSVPLFDDSTIVGTLTFFSAI